MRTPIFLSFVLLLSPLMTPRFPSIAPAQKPAGEMNSTALDQFKGTSAATLIVKEGPLIHFMSFG
ncbi:MAG: hypothetical protein ACMG6H_03570, partial [Acidobacteriota bacterium]